MMYIKRLKYSDIPFSAIDGCLYSYEIQPGPVMNLGPANSSRLTLCCQVSSTQNATDFSIQWHQSSKFPTDVSIRDSGTILVSDEHPPETKENTTNKKKIVWSKLTVDDYKDNAYYWCSVKITFSDSDISNPSTVANITFFNDTQIQTCNCGDGPAQNVRLSSKLRCAESNATVTEASDENDVCQYDDIHKPTAAESTVTTVTTSDSSDIDETNGSTTTRKVTESSTTLFMAELSKSTNHETTVETTTEIDGYKDTTTQAASSADTEIWLTTAESSKRDEIERIMLIFTVGKSLSSKYTYYT